MHKQTVKASPEAKSKIRHQLRIKGGKISQQEPVILIRASIWFIQDYAQINGLGKDDLRWESHLRYIFAGKKSSYHIEKIQKLKEKISKFKKVKLKDRKQYFSQLGSIQSVIEQTVEEEELFCHYISHGTWIRFCQGEKRINLKAFQAFCAVLDLNWEEIVEKETKTEYLAQPTQIYQNLPKTTYANFVGRKQEVKKLLKVLAPNSNNNIIGIRGIGGAGKTSLALHTAYLCLEASKKKPVYSQNYSYIREEKLVLPCFDAIVFVSAKELEFHPTIVLEKRRKPKESTTVLDIIRTIANTLQISLPPQTEIQEAEQQIFENLENQYTLLIVDNLETLDDAREVFTFLYQLPRGVKIMVTSREQVPCDSIFLDCLTETDSFQLIKHYAQIREVELNCVQSKQIDSSTGRIPAAIIYAVAQFSRGYGFDYVLDKLTDTKGDFCIFYFERTLQTIKNTPSHKLLMALSIFAHAAPKNALAQVADVTVRIDLEEGLVKLIGLSIIRKTGENYSMLPVTRECAIAQLRANLSFAEQAQQRWVNYYLKYVQQYGAKDWREWDDFTPLQRDWDNITSVVQWCIDHHRYEDVCVFWQHMKCYAHVQWYGSNRLQYWDNRLNSWTEWLIQAAKQQRDWTMAVEALHDRAYKLTLMAQKHHLVEAANLFAQAWHLSKLQQNLYPVDLMIDIGGLRLHQQRFGKAYLWFDRVDKYLAIATLEKKVKKRYLIRNNYYLGEIAYRCGNYSESKAYFEYTRQLAQDIDWHRAIYLVENWLAEIAIKEEDFPKAEKLITKGIKIAQEQEDCSRLAYCKRTLALLEKKQDKVHSACQLATEAQQIFTSLGMLPEAEETEELFEECFLDKEIEEQT